MKKISSLVGILLITGCYNMSSLDKSSLVLVDNAIEAQPDIKLAQYYTECLFLYRIRQLDCNPDLLSYMNGPPLISYIGVIPYTLTCDDSSYDKDNIGICCDDEIFPSLDAEIGDNCPYTTNFQQLDLNNNNIGDECEHDYDNDGILNDSDNCKFIPGFDELDSDNDGIGNFCDYEDNTDSDLDGVSDELDNCINVLNTSQSDADNDRIGDACDEDADNDGILNENDNCPIRENRLQVDSDNDGIGDICNVINDQIAEVESTDIKNNIIYYEYEDLIEDLDIISGPESYRGAERTNRRFNNGTGDCIVYEDDNCEYILCAHFTISNFFWEEEIYECH